MKLLNNLWNAIEYGWQYLLDTGNPYEAKYWQGTKAPATMWETLWLSWRAPMPGHESTAKEVIKPNLPWADDHFRERVGKIPVNPPPSHKIWPYNQNGNIDFMAGEVFDHTYPERFWPKFAPYNPKKSYLSKSRSGIRFMYGDYDDFIKKLVEDPETRQAYLPIWFPEDTGCPSNIRVPCTLGYHVIIRNGYLHITYFMRSLDMLRHYQDDIYLCWKLADNVRSRLAEKGIDVKLGYMSFTAINCHVFNVDLDALKYKLKTWKRKE